MPLPITPEEQAAEQALDNKLGAAFLQETAATQPDTSVEEAEPDEVEVEEEATEAVEEKAETPRDDKGRFVSKDPDVEGYLAKYGGDVEKAIKAATEAQSLIGRQGSELGELRKQFETFQQQRTQTPQSLDRASFAQLVEDDPAQATALAFQAQDAVATAAALRVWKEEDPFSASQWVTAQQIAELKSDYDQRLQASTAPLQQRVAGQDAEDALTDFARANPDVDQYLDMMKKIAQESPRILNILKEDPSIEATKEVFDFLYNKARGRTSETLATAVANTAREEQQANEAAKQQASVASATSSTETKKQSRTDAWHSQFSEFLQDDSASISSGLTNG